MNKFDPLFERLNRETPDHEHKIAVANALAECLQEVKQSFDYWEKECLSYAIAALSRNVNDDSKDTNVWLCLALTSAEKALIPSDQRNENYGRKYETISALTYGQLSSWLQQVRTAACQQAVPADVPAEGRDAV